MTKVRRDDTPANGVPVGYYRNRKGILVKKAMLRGRPFNYDTRRFGR